MNDAAIGIFDSGVGGLTVARAIMDQLPGEWIHYIGDTANGSNARGDLAPKGRLGHDERTHADLDLCLNP